MTVFVSIIHTADSIISFKNVHAEQLQNAIFASISHTAYSIISVKYIHTKKRQNAIFVSIIHTAFIGQIFYINAVSRHARILSPRKKTRCAIRYGTWST